MTDRERFAYVTRRGLQPACDGLATNDLGWVEQGGRVRHSMGGWERCRFDVGLTRAPRSPSLLDEAAGGAAGPRRV